MHEVTVGLGPKAGDILVVIGTGQAHSIAEFCEAAFRTVALDWASYVELDRSLIRKIDSHFTQANSSKIRSEIGWRPKIDFSALVSMMVNDRLRALKEQPKPEHQRGD